MSRRELLRRAVHIGLGGGAFLLPLVSWPLAALVLLAGCAMNAWLLPRVAGLRDLMRADGDGGHRGLVLYPAVLLGLVLVFREDAVPVQLAWLALAVGDGAAPLLGVRLRRPAWPWNARKAVPASVLAFLLAWACMLPLAPALRAGGSALAGLLAETLPGPIDDNLSVPLLAAGAAALIGGA